MWYILTFTIPNFIFNSNGKILGRDLLQVWT